MKILQGMSTKNGLHHCSPSGPKHTRHTLMKFQYTGDKEKILKASRRSGKKKKKIAYKRSGNSVELDSVNATVDARK